MDLSQNHRRVLYTVLLELLLNEAVSKMPDRPMCVMELWVQPVIKHCLLSLSIFSSELFSPMQKGK